MVSTDDLIIDYGLAVSLVRDSYTCVRWAVGDGTGARVVKLLVY